MVEKDYSQLTPQQFNNELRALYAQLPTDSLQGILENPNLDKTLSITMKSLEQAGRRTTSEHKQALWRKLEDILKSAHITQKFREYIWFNFSMQYELGVITDDDQYPEGSREAYKVGWLLDRNDPQSGGIFDPVRAKEIEREGFKRALSQYIRMELDESPESILSEDYDNPYEPWRQEFVEKYGEEP